MTTQRKLCSQELFTNNKVNTKYNAWCICPVIRLVPILHITGTEANLH